MKVLVAEEILDRPHVVPVIRESVTHADAVRVALVAPAISGAKVRRDVQRQN